MKSEPDTYGITDLQRDRRTRWEGVRNYGARNHLSACRPGDGVLFWHSSCSPSGLAGRAKVLGQPYPDPGSVDPKSPYFDPKSDPAAPRWVSVDIAFGAASKRLVPAAELQGHPVLKTLTIFKQGRLSVSPVSAAQWRAALALPATW